MSETPRSLQSVQTAPFRRPQQTTNVPLPARLLSAQAAAAYTGWPYTTLRDAALRGHLPVVRIPGSRRMWFDRRDLERAIEAWKVNA